MKRPDIPERKTNRSTAGAAAAKPWRVLAADGTHAPAPSIAMPKAKTELTQLLAGDTAIGVRPRPKPILPERPPVADAGLARVIEAWPRLGDSARTAMLAILDVNK